MAQTAIQDSKVPLSTSPLNGPNNQSSDFNEMFWNNMFGSGIHLPSSLNIPMTPGIFGVHTFLMKRHKCQV